MLLGLVGSSSRYIAGCWCGVVAEGCHRVDVVWQLVGIRNSVGVVVWFCHCGCHGWLILLRAGVVGLNRGTATHVWGDVAVVLV